MRAGVPIIINSRLLNVMYNDEFVKGWVYLCKFISTKLRIPKKYVKIVKIRLRQWWQQ